MSYLEYLRQTNAPPHVIADAEQAESERMMQANYTQKTQALAERERQVAYALGQVQAMQQNAGAAPSGPKRHVDQAMAQFGDDEHGQTLKAVLGPLVNAIYQDVDETLGSENRQLRQALGLVVQGGQIKERLESDLIPKYGEGVREVFPALEKAARERLYQQQPVHLEQTLWDLAPDKAAEFKTRKQQNDEKQRQRQTMSGFESMSRTTPPMAGAGYGAYVPAPGGPGGAAGQAAGAVPAPPVWDAVREYGEIREMMASGALAGA